MKRCGGGSSDGDDSSVSSADSEINNTTDKIISESKREITDKLNEAKKITKKKLNEAKKIIKDNELQCSKQKGGFLLKGLTNATKLVKNTAKKVGSTAVGATKTVAKGAMRGTKAVAKGAMRGTRKVAKGAMRGTRKVAKTLKLRGGKKQPSMKH